MGGVKISWKADDVIYEGSPRLSSISIRYKSHMLFDHNYASIWWEPKKCILQKAQRGEFISERAFLFSNACFLQTISKQIPGDREIALSCNPSVWEVS